MRKASWQEVFEEHSDYMAKMVTVMYNQYRGCTTSEGLNADSFGNHNGHVLLTNLIDEDEVVALAGLAFRKAYKEWDGVRPFTWLFRKVLSNLVSNAVRGERRHRLREIAFAMFETVDGVQSKVITESMDERVYLIPIEAVDFTDFVESLPDTHRSFVEALINASDVLGVDGNTKPKDILGALKRHVTKMGISLRQYWKITAEIAFMLEERRQNGPNKVWY